MHTPEASIQYTSQFWRDFYAKHSLRHTPSPFARWCIANQFTPDSRIMELGCGDGRDSFAFLHHGLPVIAVDACEVAITSNVAHYAEQHPAADGTFHALDFTRLDELGNEPVRLGINRIYTRFVLHAIPESLENVVLDFCFRVLPVGGRMLHEFRTIRDPLMGRGTVLSRTERMTDHYRRFIDADAFREKLTQRGWKEVYYLESNGLSQFGDDDPVVARIIAEK